MPTDAATTADPTTNPSYEPTLAYAPSSVPSESPTAAPTECRDALTAAVCAGYLSIDASACDSLFCAGIACPYSRMCDATCGLCYTAAEPVPAPTAAPTRASGAPSARPSPAPSHPTGTPTFGRTGVVQVVLAPHDRDASVIRVYVELSADLGRFVSIMLTLGDGAPLVAVRAVDDGGDTWFELEGPVRAGWLGEPRAPGHWADLVFDADEFDFAALDVAAVDISTEALESVGDRASVLYERAGGPGEALIVTRLLAGSSTALEVSVVAEATVCALGLRWQADVEAVALDQGFAGATAVDNLPGSAIGLFATENCLAGGKSQPVATLHFADGFHVESFGFLEMTVADEGGAALAVSSLAQLTTEAVSDAPTLLPTDSHPPTRVPTMAPTKFEQFCGPDPGDVDGINGVDMTDALLVAKYTQGQDLPTAACDTRIAFGCADVNADDATDVLDALLIARAFVGLVDLVWPGPPSAAPTTAMPTTEAPTFATEPPTEGPTYSPSARPTSPPSTNFPTYEPSAQPTTLWDPSPAPTAPSCDSESEELPLVRRVASLTRHAINATAFIHTGTHQRQRKRTNRRLALRQRPRIRPLPSQATSPRPPRLLNLRRAGPIHRRGSLQRLRLTRRRYQVRQRRRRKARRSRRRMRRNPRPSRSSRPTIRHGPRFRSRPPGPCQSPLMCPRRRCCRPRP